MESISYFRNIKMTPKKLRFFMPQLKKLRPVDALQLLAYTPKKPAKIFLKAIHSAMANAKQTLKVTDDLLQFKLLSIDEGQALKRFNPGSRGNAKPYKKRFSHIKIVLQVATSSPVKVKKNEASKKKDITVQSSELVVRSTEKKTQNSKTKTENKKIASKIIAKKK